jgi:nickel-type superoxide dismutase maturation protease
MLRVSGDSMMPRLRHGDLVVVKMESASLSTDGMPPVGSVVVATNPRAPSGRLIKRLASMTERSFALRSDNPFGALDSRQIGSLQLSDYQGHVRLVIKPGLNVSRI